MTDESLARERAIELQNEALDAYIKGLLNKAIALWEASLAADPSYEEPRIRLEYAFEERASILSEIEELQDGAAQNDVRATYYLAANKRTLGEHDAAIVAWQQVTRIDNTSWAKSARKMLRKHYGLSTEE